MVTVTKKLFETGNSRGGLIIPAWIVSQYWGNPEAVDIDVADPMAIVLRPHKGAIATDESRELATVPNTVPNK